uniref:Transposase MuDR plant domain-containing protein n=1 Tax=Lactuca sativa TaxID=4236 RepID=A0A9R1XXG9_LACSA|nr:hypothetical protein LSAT_V11C100004300 [Lactuca sativa]
MATWFSIFPSPLPLNSFLLPKNPCFHFPPKFLSMAEFISIKLYFQGVFINKHFCYSDGIHHVFDDIDFAGMTHKEFIGFLERFTQEKFQKVYYCQSDLEIPEGLTLISNDLEYQDFIDVAYMCGVQLPVYIDHFGTHLQAFCDVASKEKDIKDNCYVMSNMSIEMDNGIDLTLIEFMSPHKSNMEGDNEDNNVPDVKGQPRLNEDLPWKKQLPILGMRFTNPKQLKFMLCNYVVANEFELYYEKNDSKRLLVKCCASECTFRLWASWMRDEQSFQIKSLINEHNCARNFKLGLIVMGFGHKTSYVLIQTLKLGSRFLYCTYFESNTLNPNSSIWKS